MKGFGSKNQEICLEIRISHRGIAMQSSCSAVQVTGLGFKVTGFGDSFKFMCQGCSRIVCPLSSC